MFIILGVILFALLLCALIISNFVTRLFLQSKRKSDPSYDEFDEEENREAGVPVTISSKYARQGLPVFSITFMICVIGIGCILSAYYGFTTTLLIFASLFSIRRCIVVAVFLIISYAIATTYFHKPKIAKQTSSENDNVVNIWSLFKIKFADIVHESSEGETMKKKQVMYLEDALAFYKTLGYFWISLLVILVVI